MECLKKKHFFVAFRLWLYEKQLGLLSGIFHSRRCCWYTSNLFYFHFVFYDKGWWRVYRNLAFRSKMTWTKININTLARVARQKLCKCVCTSLNQQRVKLILPRGNEHVSILARSNWLYINTKIYYRTYWASAIIRIFFPYKHPARK